MTIEEAAALAKLPAAQARVVYKPGDRDKKGTIVAVDGSDVIVRFDGEPTSRATRPEDLAAEAQEPDRPASGHPHDPAANHHDHDPAAPARPARAYMAARMVADVNTGGKLRADEMTVDVQDRRNNDRREALSANDRQGLIALARALSELEAVDAVYLSIPPEGSNVFLLIAIIGQDRIDASRVGPPPRETPLEMTLRNAGYPDSAGSFVSAVGDEQAASLWRLGLVQVWAFPAAGVGAAPYVYNAEARDFVSR